MKLKDFLSSHPVFTSEEFAVVLNREKRRSKRTSESLLAYYINRGQILRVRRGLYVSVPPGMNAETCPTDPFLLAGKMTTDAVLAYHTALQFHGRAYSTRDQFVYCTRRLSRPATFRGYQFRGVAFPKKLQEKGKESFAIDVLDRTGLDVRVTCLERTLVDVLDRPVLGGGWEELWRSLDSIEFFNLDRIVEYALLLENATTAAKVGFYLTQRRDELMVSEKHVVSLREHRPKKPHYLDRRGRKTGRFVPEWNLVVPVEVIERSWQEVP
jgi:predicted transcriptional regulator of viral defense system